MILRKRVDVNQPTLVKQIRTLGATVQILSNVGHGCPDILVGYGGRNYLFEIKNGDLPKSQQKLTTDEVDWHQKWHGQVCIVNSFESVKNVLLY